MSDAIDQTVPTGQWEFDEGVTAVFDNMLARSIPQYEEMRRLVFEIGCRYVKPHTDIVDLGCSRGEAMAPFVGPLWGIQSLCGRGSLAADAGSGACAF